MIRRALGSGFLAVVACVLLLAGARPADASFDVQERGKTITVTQLDTTKLTVIVNFGGGIVVNDGVTVVGYPPATDLVVRGSDALTPSQLDVVVHQALPGSLTLDLPGANDVTVRGTAATIKGSLKVKGSDAAGQIVRLGEPGLPVTIEGSAKLDMRGGDDKLLFRNDGTILGSLTANGVNELRADVLNVGGKLSVNVKRESRGVVIRGETEQDVAAFVGKSLRVVSGPGADSILLGGGGIGGSATFKIGDGVGDLQRVWTQGSTIGGSFVVDARNSTFNSILFTSTIKGSVKITTDAADNSAYIEGPVEGTSIKYTGGHGRHEVRMRSTAPKAIATIKLGASNDTLLLEGDHGLALKRLHADLGGGSDDLDLYGFELPPGSTVKGLP